MLVAVALVAYLTGTIDAIYGFDLAMLAALVGGFPIYSSALLALARKQISADLAVSLAAFAALYLGYTGEYSENMYLVAAEVILIMLIGEALEHYAIDRTRDGITALLALRPETVRVRAGDHDHIVPIDEKRFGFMVQQTPYFAVQVMKITVERLRLRMQDATRG